MNRLINLFLFAFISHCFKTCSSQGTEVSIEKLHPFSEGSHIEWDLKTKDGLSNILKNSKAVYNTDVNENFQFTTLPKKNLKMETTLVDENFDIPSDNGFKINNTDEYIIITQDPPFLKNSPEEGSGENPEEQTEIIIEGSADVDNKEVTSTPQITTLQTVTTNTEDTESSHTGMPMVNSERCFDTMCGAEELYSSTVIKTVKIPENSNFSYTCSFKPHNISSYHLYWYRSNMTLQSAVMHNKLEMTLTNTSLSHSGIYKCVKWTPSSCCYIVLQLRVYVTPDYRYHLLIAGIIAAVSLLLCLLLGTWRNWRLKSYTKHLKTLKVNKEQLLLP